MIKPPYTKWINDIKTKLGFNRTMTASGEDVVDAVNKQSQQIGDLAELETAVKTDLVSAVNENTQEIVKVGDGLATPTATGTTNNTGSIIAKNTYFRLDDVLCIALADIADGGTFTNGTNYRPVTEGGLNAINTLLTGELFKIAALTGFISDSDLTAGQYGTYSGTITIPNGYKSLMSMIILAHPGAAGGLVVNTSVSYNQKGRINYYGSFYTPKAISRANTDYILSILCIKDDYNFFI